MTTAVRPAPLFSRSVRASTPNPVAVRLAGLSKCFAVRRGARDMLRRPAVRWAVDNVSCEVKTGEFFGILGPNGAGKSTLFRLLSTLVVPDRGSAWVHGLDLVHDARRVRRVVVPVIGDERSLYWRLSASENLRLFAALYGVPRQATRARIHEVLQQVGLANTERQLAGTFSSGMRQRLLIGRALLARPMVLLLDEPTRSLDPVAARDFRTFLREEIVRRSGCTVLLATHSAEEALGLCDRVAILDRGALVASGRASELVREFGDQRYLAVVRSTGEPAWRSLQASGRIRGVSAHQHENAGWTTLEFELVGSDSPHDAADVLDMLRRAGAVARFEPRPVSLAELIERVTATKRNECVDA